MIKKKIIGPSALVIRYSDLPEEKLFISILNLSQLNEKPMSALQLRKIGLWIMEIGDMQKICPIKKYVHWTQH